ncbi:MAG: hypothetical protein V4850_20210 [Myxococcota bacterium]
MTLFHRSALAGTLALVLSGCGSAHSMLLMADTAMECTRDREGVPRRGFVDDLQPEGCGYTVGAVDEPGNTQLVLDVPAFADAAAGNPASVVYTLPDAAVRLEVLVGCGLGEDWCGEDRGSGSLSRTFTPTSGTLTVDVTPDGDEADAVVILDDVELEDESGETVVVDTTWDVRLYAAH